VIKNMQRFQEDRGFSAWHLVLIFLGAVAVCAVFFSLGFVVGFNHQSTKAAATTENVTPTTDVPPTVNSPLETSSQLSNETVTPETVTPSPVVQPEAVPPQLPAHTQARPATHVTRESAAKPAARSRAEHELTSRRETRSAPAAANSGNSHFAVQVMASKTKADAITLIRLLEARSYHVFLVSPKNAHAGDTLYRVQVGPFASRADAERTRHKLEGEGFKPFIVH